MLLHHLFLGTGNPYKIKEIVPLLQPLGIEVTVLGDDIDEPNETGHTLEENARLKATYYFMKTGIPTLADDSGFVIPALDGQPGVFSKRWAGPDENYEGAFKRIYSLLEEKNLDRVAAYFETCLALALNEKQILTFTGRIHGTLPESPRGARKFGYDPIFIPDTPTNTQAQQKTFAEMTLDEKNKFSHRAQAVKKFITALKTHDLIPSSE